MQPPGRDTWLATSIRPPTRLSCAQPDTYPVVLGKGQGPLHGRCEHGQPMGRGNAPPPPSPWDTKVLFAVEQAMWCSVTPCALALCHAVCNLPAQPNQG